MILRAFLAALLGLAVAAAPAFAGSRPARGEYILVTPILDGVARGEIVPIFIHLTVEGDRMEFRFTTTYQPDIEMCEREQKCHRTVPGLRLRFDEAADSRITVRSYSFHTGSGMTIDRADVDTGHILAPTLRTIDGAEVAWSKNAVTFTSRGRRGARTARFVAGDMALLEDALGLAMSFDIALGPLDYCITRQIVEIANKPAPSEAEVDLLRAAKGAGRLMRLAADADYYSLAEDRFPGPREVLDHIRLRRTVMRIAIGYPAPDDWDGKDILALLEPVRSGLKDEFFPAYAESVFGHEDEILALRRHAGRITALVERGEDLSAAVCRSVLLDGR